MVLGIQNYFKIATSISLDCRDLHRAVMTVLTNRLNTEKGSRLKRDGGVMTESEKERYGNSKMVRYVSGINKPIYPIAFVKYKVAIGISSAVCCFTEEGRGRLHEDLKLNKTVMSGLYKQKIYNHSLEYLDCRQSLFAAQQGRCVVSGEIFKSAEEIACCLKISSNNGGKEQYRNMVLVERKYEPLIQSRKKDVLQYLEALRPDKKILDKINKLRQKNGKSVIG